MNQEKIDCISAIAQNQWTLKFASDELRGDKDVILACVSLRGFTLQFASDELRNNKDVVLAAVIQNGWAIQFASENLRGNKEVVLALVVTQNGWGFQFASENLKDDKYFLYEIDQVRKITKGTPVFICLSESIQNKIDKNPDYLLKFAPVYLKPARS
jgi:hypothetical protein